jgi:exo-beta-1,3-glucanase (GH17 family)
MSAVVVDGKQFARGGERFLFRGVTYGTFAPRGDGALFPDSDAVKKDFSRMAERGFTVVRTYTAPPEDVLELAEEWRLQILAGVFYPDWRYLVGASASGRREILRGARRVVAETSSRLAGHDAVLGLCLGNEIPADVIRWVGVERIQRAMGDLVSIAR